MAGDVVFVLPGRSEADLEYIRSLDVDRDWRFFENGVVAWVAQTYLLLRASVLPVELSNVFSPDAINIAHASQLANLDRPRGCYVIATRADYPAVRWCQLHIVQNRTQVSDHAIWLPHWLQPGLIPRDARRGERVERVGYFGLPVNHYSKFFHRPSGYFLVRDAIREICAGCGLDLVERGPESWNDFSDVDVVLGLREFGTQPFDTKPPTKLMNAWSAGAVFIGGADSAYAQIGQPGESYLPALTRAACKCAIEDLVAGTIVYRSLLAAGSAAALDYTRARILERWVAVLSDLLKSGRG